MIAVIAAVARNGVIGVENRLPWRLPADLRRFRQLTMGHVLVMGRKTYESIGRPLPGRTTIVLTRQPSWRADGVETAGSLEEALTRAAGRDMFIAGGAEIFAPALALADRLYLTRIEADYPGDTHFPEVDEARWRLAARERHEAGPDFPHAYEFQDYEAHQPG